jgi:hypothetical protein
MERYFDAHVYSSDIGQCQFILRVPKPLISPEEAIQATGFGRDRGTYGGSAFSIHDSGQYWLLDWSYTDEDGYDERFQMDEDGPGWMAQLAPLRDELLRGDRRPLYLGWLAALCSKELDDDDLEPPIPPGLQTLTAAQQALVAFLQLDPDLLAVAQSASEEDAGADLHTEMLEEWMRDLPPDDMRNVVRLIMTGAAHQAERGIRAQYASWQQRRNPAGPRSGERRTVAQIEAGRSLAEQVRIERERVEQEEANACRQAERARELAAVAGRAKQIWQELDVCLRAGSGAAYERAQRAILELHEALKAGGKAPEFHRGLVKLLSTHGHRRAWVDRLRRVGLM